MEIMITDLLTDNVIVKKRKAAAAEVSITWRDVIFCVHCSQYALTHEHI